MTASTDPAGAANGPGQAVRALTRVSRVLENASGELSLAHYRVLSAILAGDESATRLSSRLAVGKPAVSAAVDALCQRGLVARSGVPGDLRVATLRLTNEGREVLIRVETAMIGQLEELCALSPDRGRLIGSLVWLGAAIDERAAAREERARRRPAPVRAHHRAGQPAVAGTTATTRDDRGGYGPGRAPADTRRQPRAKDRPAAVPGGPGEVEVRAAAGAAEERR